MVQLAKAKAARLGGWVGVEWCGGGGSNLEGETRENPNFRKKGKKVISVENPKFF